MSTIRGVRFQTKQGDKITLNEIFKPLNIERYYWRLDNIQIYRDIKEKDDWDFEQPYQETGTDLINRLEKGYSIAIFGEFIGFPTLDDIRDISTYQEFLISKAQIVILLVDCYFIDVYLKDIGETTKYYKYIKTLGFEPELIDQDDPRYKLKVF